MAERTEPERLASHDDLLVLVALLFTFAYFHTGGGPSQNSRYALTRSLVHRLSLTIDPYHQQTFDKARHQGRYFSDKAPGLAVAATPGYALSLLARETPNRGGLPELQERLHLATFLSVGVVSALGGVCLLRLLRDMGTGNRLAMSAALLWTLGTPALAYSTTLMSHQFVAALLIAAAWVLRSSVADGAPWRPAVAGLAAALAVVSEYPAAIPAGVMFVYGLAVVRPRRCAAWFVVGAIPVLAAGAVYHWACFGAPWRLGYHHEVLDHFRAGMARGLMGLTYPRPQVLWEVIFGGYRGILALSPFLVLAAPGFWLLWRRKELRREWWLCLVVSAFYVLLASSYYQWDGGCSMGSRHLVPMLPFLMVPTAFGLARYPRLGAALAAWGVLVCLAAVATLPEFPDSTRPHPTEPGRETPTHSLPVFDVALHLLLKGGVSEKAVLDDGRLEMVTPDRPDHAWDAYNMGEVAGLPGAWSLAPLLVFWALVARRLFGTADNRRSPAAGRPLAQTERHAPALAVAVAAALLLWGLDRPMFWHDEAITAIYSRNTLLYGWPKAWDGRNLCAYHLGTSVSPTDLGAWTYPLLQFYVTAGGFAMFGESTWAGRLPHAALGLGTVWLAFLAGRRLTQDRTAAVLSAILLAGSAQFLRFSRNCRYFSLTMFLAVAWVWLYLRVPERRWREAWRPGWAAVLLAFASVLLFHAHFLAGAAFVCAAAAALLLVDRPWRRLPALAPLAAVTALLVGGYWHLVVRPSGAPDAAAAAANVWGDAAVRLWWYVRDMNFAQVAPICVVAFAVWCALSGRLQPAARRGVILILVTMALHVALVCVLSDQPVREGVPDADLRYVAPLIPLGAILAAILCAEAWRRSRLVGGLAAAVALLTGAFSLNLGCGFLGEYVTETFHLRPVPPTSTEVAVQYLAGRARQDSLALVTPVYRRDPLMFYLGDRLRFCGILPADDRRIVPRARELGLPEYVYSGQVDPDWVVWFRMERRGLRQDILDNIRPLAHKPPVALRVWWDDLSRPELTRHQAFPPQITDANIQQAVWVVERDRGR